MKSTHVMKGTWGLLSLVALFLLSSVALAQTGAPYDLTWSSIDGGGETSSTGGSYTLGGTIGQPDANLLIGGDYTLGGGFWGGGALGATDYKLYLPLAMRGYG